MKTITVLLGCFLAGAIALGGPAQIQVTKCTVAAGKGASADSITVSGILLATEQDFLNAAEATVELNCATMLSPLPYQFDITEITFKKGKFNGKDEAAIFACDTKTSKFSLLVKKVDLMGLQCPFTLTITVGSFSETCLLDEAIVNGTKLCPSILMMGVQNSLDVTKFVPKAGKTTNSDSFTAQGTFRISGQFDDLSQPFILTLGSQTFTVPGSVFKSAKGIVSCTNAPAAEGGLVSAKFDTNTGAFTIAVKNIFIADYGVVKFDLSLFGILLGGLYTADLGPQQVFSLENELRHFNLPNGIWNFDPFGYNIISGLSGSTYYSRFGYSGDEDTLYWYTNDQGTYLKRASLSGDFFNCDIDVDVLTNPPLLRSGQTFTSQANFTGSLNVWVPDNPDIDVDISNFAGTVKITTKAVKWETVSAMGGTYTALKIEQTFALSAPTMNVYVDDPSRGSIDTTGTFTGTYKLTYWCEPSIGVIKLIDTGSEKVTARGAGSLAHNWNTAYTLTDYLR